MESKRRSLPSSTIAAVSPTSTTDVTATAQPDKAGGPEGGPKDHDSPENDGECKLLGPFALLVQGALGALALSSLVYKRWRETPGDHSRSGGSMFRNKFLDPSFCILPTFSCRCFPPANSMSPQRLSRPRNSYKTTVADNPTHAPFTYSI